MSVLDAVDAFTIVLFCCLDFVVDNEDFEDFCEVLDFTDDVKLSFYDASDNISSCAN